eukprot:COSAG02_NODE_11194_length_1773_cov_1.493429_2_plen_70_part_00
MLKLTNRTRNDALVWCDITRYGYGQVKISYVFCVYSVVGLAAAIFCARASRVVWERTLLLAGQVMIGMG